LCSASCSAGHDKSGRKCRNYFFMQRPVIIVPAGHDGPSGAPAEQTTETSTSSSRRPFFARQLLYETLDQMHRLDREDLGVLGRLLVLPGLRVLWLQVVLRLLAALEVRLDPVDLVDQSKMQARGSAWLPQNTWLSLARLLHSASIIAEVCRERQCSRVTSAAPQVAPFVFTSERGAPFSSD